jgi:hypothetical protein
VNLYWVLWGLPIYSEILLEIWGRVMELERFSPFADGLVHPEGVAWGPAGYVYAGGEAGQAYRADLDERGKEG